MDAFTILSIIGWSLGLIAGFILFILVPQRKDSSV